MNATLFMAAPVTAQSLGAGSMKSRSATVGGEGWGKNSSGKNFDACMEDYSDKRVATEKSLPTGSPTDNREIFTQSTEEKSTDADIEREWTSLWVGGSAEFMVQMQVGQGATSNGAAPATEEAATEEMAAMFLAAAGLSEAAPMPAVPTPVTASAASEAAQATPCPATALSSDAAGVPSMAPGQVPMPDTSAPATAQAAQTVATKVVASAPKTNAPATPAAEKEAGDESTAALLEGFTAVSPQPLMGAITNSSTDTATTSQDQEQSLPDRNAGRFTGISQERMQSWFEQKPGSEVVRLARNEQASELMKHALDAAQQASLPKRLTMELASPTGAAVTLVLTSRKGEIHAQLETANPQALQWVNEQMKTFRSLDAGQTVRWLPAQMVEVARRETSFSGDTRGDGKGGAGGRSSDRSESGSKLETGDRAVRGRGERNNKDSREKKS